MELWFTKHDRRPRRLEIAYSTLIKAQPLFGIMCYICMLFMCIAFHHPCNVPMHLSCPCFLHVVSCNPKRHAKPVQSFPNHAQILSTLERLVIPSKRQQLSMGTYCAVKTLMISCATIPPARDAMLCNSLPPALVISTQI